MGLKPTTELLIKAFILSRSRPKNSPALSGPFVGLLVLYFIWHVSSHGSVLPCFRGGTRGHWSLDAAKKKTQDNCSAGGEIH